jgi:hypothetical protein
VARDLVLGHLQKPKCDQEHAFGSPIICRLFGNAQTLVVEVERVRVRHDAPNDLTKIAQHTTTYHGLCDRTISSVRPRGRQHARLARAHMATERLGLAAGSGTAPLVDPLKVPANRRRRWQLVWDDHPQPTCAFLRTCRQIRRGGNPQL